MRYVLALIILFFTIGVSAQIRFVASMNSKQVLEGDYFTVTYTLYNARGSNLSPPNFNGFKKMGPPSQSFKSSNINGKMSFETAYSFSLLAQTKGSYQILPATIVAQGKTYTSNTLTVEVVERKARNSDATLDNPFYVNIELNTDTAYIGQQVILDYKLYTTVNLRSFDLRFEPEYSNTFAINIPTYNHFPEQYEIIDGTRYLTKIMKRVALFPLQYGTVTMDPASINLGIEYEDKNSRSFFFRTRVKVERVQTNEATLTILPLPPNAPESFNGAVGNYSMNSYLTQSTGKTNEALNMIMTITGDGDEKRLLDPILDFGDTFEVYDPNIISSKNDASGPTIRSSKQFEYLIVPKETGRFTLTPTFTFFNPDSAQYMTLADSLPVRIVAGNAIASQVDPIQEDHGLPDMRFIHADRKLHTVNQHFFGSSWHLILLALPLLTLLGGVFYKRYLIREGNLDISEIKYRRARKIAIQRLEKAKIFQEAGDARSFYDEISKATLGYVSDKYNIPASELSKSNIRETIQSKGYNEEIQNRFLYLLDTAEKALFAGMTSSENLESIYQESIALISEMEHKS